MGPHISFLLKGIARWDSKLIKGDRQKGSRVSLFGPRQMGHRPIIFWAESGPVVWASPARFNIILYILYFILYYLYIYIYIYEKKI